MTRRPTAVAALVVLAATFGVGVAVGQEIVAREGVHTAPRGLPVKDAHDPTPRRGAPAPSRVATPLWTSPAPRADRTRSASDPLDWPALAECESGGNPRAVSPTGRFRGAYQFNRESWAWVGMTGDPIDAPLATQTEAARRLFARQGARAAWPYCSRYLRRTP